MRRKIIEIDQEKCNGCGLCVGACHEGALQMVDGKARLVSDEYCDGLGDCLPECPVGAISIVEREAKEYNEELVAERMNPSCPGKKETLFKVIQNVSSEMTDTEKDDASQQGWPSELRQWPVQLNLINTQAAYLKNADLLIAADCTAYAYADFHKKFMKGRITLIGCPKLDDNEHYTEKITEILKLNNPSSITVVRMEVPCCGGIIQAVKTAMLKSGVIVPYNEVTINNQGMIVKR